MKLNQVTTEAITPRPISVGYLTFGCDPEFFLTKDGQVVGSEKIIPEGGLIDSIYKAKSIIRDGIQVEMNPGSNHCRANLSNQMQAAFLALKIHLDKTKSGLEVCFTTTHTVSKKEMDSLSEQSKRLGCAPSHNCHDENASIKVNPMTYRRRSAGGHIHVGSIGIWPEQQKVDLVKVMDILIGNTCVLIDRDPLAAARRKVYGRAGEYRLPSHGVEYRTLSNFWLHSYQLMSLVMGLARLSVSVMYTTHSAPQTAQRINTWKMDANGSYIYQHGPAPRWNAFAYLMSLVDMKDIRKAINTNDLELAWKNWEGVRKFIDTCVINRPGLPVWEAGLDHSSTANFEHFARMIQQHATDDRTNGLSYWFKQDPLTHWCTKGEGHGIGWEGWIKEGPVRADLIEKAANMPKFITVS